MREILFRGKRVDNGEWVKGSYLRRTHPCIEYFHFAEDGVPEPDIAEIIPETVGQYTGLNDKNGTKIFGGDIVSFEDAENDFYGYHDNVFINCGVVSVCPYGGVFFSNRQTVDMDDLYKTDDMIDAEVLGNVYDNPELLENSQNFS